MTTLKTNKNEQLFTDLTSEQAAILEGGKKLPFSSSFNINGDKVKRTAWFTAPKTGTVRVESFGAERSGWNAWGGFSVTLIRRGGNRRKEGFKLGNDEHLWSVQPGKSYRVLFKENRIGRVEGKFKVSAR